LFAAIGYLTTKPKHATVSRNSTITFICRSDTDYLIQWRFTPAYSSIESTRTINARVFSGYARVDSNGTLHLYSVSKSDAGIYRCEDRDEAAFAELYVVGE